MANANRLYRTIWLAILAAHATAAIMWWWTRPGGFPIRSPHFWANEILPWPIAIIAIAARFLLPRRPALASALLVMFPIAWIAASIAGRVVFPISFQVLWLAPMLVSTAMLGLWLASMRSLPQRWILLAPALIVSIGLGVMTPLLQRAPAPSTHPLNLPPPSVETMTSP